MALTFADRVKETTTTTGTGTLNLDGAETGFQGFVAGVGDANTCVYAIEAVDGDGVPTGDWEVGIGTVTDAATDTLSRDTIIASSNGGAAVNLSAGTKNVFSTLSSAMLQRTQGQSDIVQVQIDANGTQTANIAEFYDASATLRTRIASNGGITDDGGSGSDTNTVYGADASVNATKVQQTAIGHNATCSNHQTTAIGEDAICDAQGATALGFEAACHAGSSVAVGQSADCRTGSPDRCTIVGARGGAGQNNDVIVLGHHADAEGTNQFVAGSDESRIDDIYFGNGVTYTSPSGIVVHGTGGSGTDIGGGDLGIAGGQGTGTGAGGKVTVQGALSTTTGSSLNALSTICTWDIELANSPAAITGSGEQVSVAEVATTDGTVTTLATINTATDNIYHVEAVVVASETTDHDEAASYKIIGTFKNDGGTLSQVGSTTADHTAEDTAGWDCVFDTNTTDIRVRVTGAAATNVTWHGVVKVVSVA